MKIVVYMYIALAIIGALLGLTIGYGLVAYANNNDEWKKVPFMYVFNEETQMWDRARPETLKDAKCENIRQYFR